MRDQLMPQGGLYTLQTRSSDQSESRIIGIIRKVLLAPESPKALVAAMTNPGVKIVTLTITEKGYKIDPGSGAPREDGPERRRPQQQSLAWKYRRRPDHGC
ncbi:hypothetical protein [Hyphomonas sp.]|uniref:hypothetical protein n=1 Tax=Hyphomonas sp. TaxID=87 RepID=UPI00391A3365